MTQSLVYVSDKLPLSQNDCESRHHVASRLGFALGEQAAQTEAPDEARVLRARAVALYAAAVAAEPDMAKVLHSWG